MWSIFSAVKSPNPSWNANNIEWAQGVFQILIKLAKIYFTRVDHH